MSGAPVSDPSPRPREKETSLQTRPLPPLCSSHPGAQPPSTKYAAGAVGAANLTALVAVEAEVEARVRVYRDTGPPPQPSLHFPPDDQLQSAQPRERPRQPPRFALQALEPAQQEKGLDLAGELRLDPILDLTPVSFSSPTLSSHQQHQQPPSDPLPESLVSPAFTPPSTPGPDTPPPAPSVISGLGRPPRLPAPYSVPVDSTDLVGGGCGTKRPQLLERLPAVQCVVRARIPTTTGAEMFLHLYENDADSKEHLAIVFGNSIRSRSLDAERPGETEMDRLVRGAYTGRLYPGRTRSSSSSSSSSSTRHHTEKHGGKKSASSNSISPPLVRIHSECYTGETVWSARCDCGEQLDEAARLMSLPENQSGGGIIIYLRQEGRGIGLSEKLKAYNLQDLGNDTVQANLLLRHPADARSYGLATAMLQDLGQTRIRLLTNNPDKIRAVEGPNREVVVSERVAMVPLSWKGQGGFRTPEVEGYLRTKIEKMGHLLPMALMPPAGV